MSCTYTFYQYFDKFWAFPLDFPKAGLDYGTVNVFGVSLFDDLHNAIRSIWTFPIDIYFYVALEIS